MGSIFAVRPGLNNDIPPIGLGSHLGWSLISQSVWVSAWLTLVSHSVDTQPAGGKYDGIVGVMSALEVLRALHKNNITTYAPIAAIDWTNEEGARFPPAMISSGVWCGAFDLAFG